MSNGLRNCGFVDFVAGRGDRTGFPSMVFNARLVESVSGSRIDDSCCLRFVKIEKDARLGRPGLRAVAVGPSHGKADGNKSMAAFAPELPECVVASVRYKKS